MSRDSVQGLLKVLVCDSLSGGDPRSMNGIERGALNKLLDHLLESERRKYEFEVLDAAKVKQRTTGGKKLKPNKQLRLATMPMQSDSVSCGFFAGFLYPLLLRRVVAPLLAAESEGDKIDSGRDDAEALVPRAFPLRPDHATFRSLPLQLHMTASRILSASKGSASSRDLLLDCHKVAHRILEEADKADRSESRDDRSSTRKGKQARKDHGPSDGRRKRIGC